MTNETSPSWRTVVTGEEALDMREQLRKDREGQEHLRNLAKWSDAYVDPHGVVRWKSNDRIPFSDMLEVWHGAGLKFNMALSLATRKIEDAASIREYAAAQANRTPEQIAEQRAMARAAHGPGVKLMNVFTGEKFTT